MLRFFVCVAFVTTISALTCYNGMKMVRGQSVGQSTEDCGSSSAYCYNMSASALILVDVMKAGCSTWRCMLARDKCISTTFQMIPVQLCCCSSDRCNVGENAIGWDQNWNQQGGSGGFGNNNNNDNNYNGFEQNFPDNSEGGGQGQMQNMNVGQNWATPDKKKKPSHSRADIEKAFKMDVDTTTPASVTQSGGEEEMFVRKDARTTPRPARHGANSGGRREGDEIIL